MKPGDEIEHDGQTWDIEKLELRGSGIWVLLVRHEGESKKFQMVGRSWVEQSKLLADWKEKE